MILRIKYVILVSGDDNDAVIALFRETYVDLVVVHNAPDVFASKADQPPVNSWVNIDFLSTLIVLWQKCTLKTAVFFFK